MPGTYAQDPVRSAATHTANAAPALGEPAAGSGGGVHLVSLRST